MRRSALCAVAAVALAATLLRSQPATPEPPPRWQHARLAYSKHLKAWEWVAPPRKPVNDYKSMSELFTAIGGGAKAEDGITYVDYVAAAGTEGWELVGSNTGPQGDWEMWFKRPLR